MSAEQIYEQLLENSIKIGGMSGKGVIDDHSKWGKFSDGGNKSGNNGYSGGLSPSAAKQLEDEWKARVAAAAQAVRSQGKCPAGLERLIDELLEPYIPWREVLADYMERSSTNMSGGLLTEGIFILAPIFLPLARMGWEK